MLCQLWRRPCPQLDEAVRRRYARGDHAVLAGAEDPRIESVFAHGPAGAAFCLRRPGRSSAAVSLWTSSDPADLYDDVLVAIDRPRGINNGEPALHAAWLAAVDPQPGETVIHVGAGHGYYTRDAVAASWGRAAGSRPTNSKRDLAADAAAISRPMRTSACHAQSAYGRAAAGHRCHLRQCRRDGAGRPTGSRALKPARRLIFPWQPHGGLGAGDPRDGGSGSVSARSRS